MRIFRSRRSAPRLALLSILGLFLILVGVTVSERGEATNPPAPAPVLAAIGEKNEEAAILAAARQKAASEQATERSERSLAD